ncbi:MAG: hemolysin family protein [Acholeplasmatales bacterium]|nr:hemolysin family protein [Acholeplasmatales bacterium]
MDIQSVSIIPLSGSVNFNVGIFIAMLILIVLSGFFSMSETAFSSTSDTKLRILVEERKAGAKKALQLASKFDWTLIVLLIGNNIVNISLSTIAVIFFTDLAIAEEYISLVSTAVITFVVLIFGEILPKVIAKQHAEGVATKVAWIAYIIGIILTPLVYFFLGIQKVFTRNQNEDKTPDEDELGVLITQMEDKGEIEHDEATTIRNVFDLNDRNVEDIMIPRIKMEAIAYNATLEEVKAFMIDNPFSRIPVYKNDKDHIVGVLYERDFFPALVKNPRLSWRKVMRPVKFVAATMKVDALIQELQASKTHIAIVSGEYGDVLGLVTMEDALEEIVGEIYDEHDNPGDNDLEFSEQEDGSFIIDGEWFVEDVFDKLGVGDVPENVPSKVSGWLFARCESLPKVGFSMDYTAIYTKENEEDGEYVDYAKTLTFEIYEVSDRRITLAKVVIRDATPEEVEAKVEADEED